MINASLRRRIRGWLPLSITTGIDRFRQRMSAFRHRGDRLQCPACEGSFGAFRSAGVDSPAFSEHDVVGGGRRANALCPGCNSLERERLIALYLRDIFASLDRSAYRLLHVAPEPCLRKLFRDNPAIDHVTADLSARGVDLKLDVTDTGLVDGAFDIIVCNHVLEHVPDDAKAMRELLRILTPGGVALLQVPMAPKLDTTIEDPTVQTEADRERVFGQFDHVRLYGRDYLARLARVGFDVTTVLPSPEEADRYALDSREMLYVCRKPAA